MLMTASDNAAIPLVKLLTVPDSKDSLLAYRRNYYTGLLKAR